MPVCVALLVYDLSYLKYWSHAICFLLVVVYRLCTTGISHVYNIYNTNDYTIRNMEQNLKGGCRKG